jgi:hypothetical protein
LWGTRRSAADFSDTGLFAGRGRPGRIYLLVGKKFLIASGMPPDRLQTRQRRQDMKILVILLFAVIATLGIILFGIHKIKQPISTPPSPIASGGVG